MDHGDNVSPTTCPICLNDFTSSSKDPGVVPCLLYCGHTFHRQCIAAMKILSTRIEIVCPICRQPTPGTAQILKPNFALLEVLEFLETEKKSSLSNSSFILPCDECNDGTPSVVFCNKKAVVSHTRLPADVKRNQMQEVERKEEEKKEPHTRRSKKSRGTKATGR